MEKLRAWLMRRKFALQLERGLTDEVDLLARVVSINASNCYQTRLATLMHECGHVQIFLSRIRSPKLRLCGCSLLEDFGSVGRCDRRGRAARLSLLQEEIQAWDLGEDLAKRLSLRFTRKHLEKVRVSALMTYVHFTAAQMRSSPKAHVTKALARKRSAAPLAPKVRRSTRKR